MSLPMPKSVIDDSNYLSHVVTIERGDAMGGYNNRDYSASPFKSPAAREIITDRKEWKERIKDRQELKSTPYHAFLHYKVPLINQKRLPYCWCYGPTGAEMTVHAIQGNRIPRLSATSVAAKIKNYREVGGWALEAIEGKDKWGTGELDLWPEAEANRKYDTPELRANALLNKISKYEEMPTNNIFAATVSYLLYGFPVTLGLAWWGHLVYAVDVIERNGQFLILIVNSWGPDWEDNGLALLAESKATAHEAVAIMGVTPSLRESKLYPASLAV